MKRFTHPILLSCYSTVLFFLMVVGILHISCDSFVEADSPQSQLPSEAVFENYATASAAITDIYAKMRDRGMLTGQSSGISYQLGSYCDELDYYGSPTAAAAAFNTNALLPSNNLVQDYWSVAYNQIYAANSVLERLETSTALSEEQITQLQGEAYFIRAMVHFYLTNLFGEIPYIKTTDYRLNSRAPKVTVKEVYSFTIHDLEQAATLLEKDYLRAERTRPNRYAVLALLSRVYLYDEKWAEAANAASVLLNATELYTLQSDLKRVFLKESKETIWQQQPSIAGKNTDQAASFIFFTVPPPSAALTAEFINSFASTDLRKSNWTGSMANASSTWYYTYKFKEFYNTPVSKEYPVVLRLAEQYLIRAEARAQQGDLISSKEDLNRIRQRAGLAQALASSKEELLQAILEERKLELFSEYGHRFFDLKRNGQLDQALSTLKPGWNTTDRLFPLPQNEINLNPTLLPQNDGY
ncbi:RagB/SusD family nutrient uptake outer membrane protein [Flavobacterium agrisoli]|uniref:RagB/SusD family nutrient uptake outer membrane protein n=1 Tax=Flavobacterium agrisoli TaxID=2793066 RepID=A0A934UHX6_9FLAO|nr:RagB/SusD family nutrient uptake outer membrane protein [Flavobacterium agrisoli]MBK0368251.1 RagB/SusD family nutrient uptake outer membrane protein [Flavobacterium agrisoli]